MAQNYERTATGTYRCFVDNTEYSKVENIPDYEDWAVLDTQDNLNPKAYVEGTDPTVLPTDWNKFPFLKNGMVAISKDGTIYYYNANEKAWRLIP